MIELYEDDALVNSFFITIGIFCAILCIIIAIGLCIIIGNYFLVVLSFIIYLPIIIIVFLINNINYIFTKNMPYHMFITVNYFRITFCDRLNWYINYCTMNIQAN